MRPRFLSALSFACAAMLLTHDADARSRARVALAPTAADANASGRARLSIKSPSDGQFEVKIRRLDPNTTYQLIVGGVHVGDITTTGGGNGKVRFRSRPRNDRDLPLGFDPQNATIVVRNAAGVDVLTATLPDANPDNDDDVVCCIPDDSGGGIDLLVPEIEIAERPVDRQAGDRAHHRLDFEALDLGIADVGRLRAGRAREWRRDALPKYANARRLGRRRRAR